MNLLAARLPRFRRSWGVVVGTNIANGALLDDLMTGVGVGRVLGDAGLITGVIWEHRTKDEVDAVTKLNRQTEYRAPPLLPRVRPEVLTDTFGPPKARARVRTT